jgi:hypothetical protein
MNVHASGFVGCSITFAIHFVASQVSRRPFALLMLAIALWAALMDAAAPMPPAPRAPSVPSIAFLKQVK